MRPGDVPLREAFDLHAGGYDEAFTRNPLGCALRARSWAQLDRVFSPGDRVIDLGCGTGEDAVHLARRGVSVLAVDLSGEMIRRVREKVERAGVGDRVELRVADFTAFVGAHGIQGFDGLYSNFGALNCAPDLDWLAGTARWLKPDAHVVLVVMSPFYPLEFGIHLLRGRIGPATRRWHVPGVARIEGVEFPVRYPGLRRLGRALGVDFALESAEALHLLMPVPGLEHLNDACPRFFRACRRVDRWLSGRRVFRGWGDHSLSVWRLRGE